MNIFILDLVPQNAGALHCDKHVVKMIVETAQLLSTAHRVLDGVETITHKPTARGTLRKSKGWHINDHRELILYKATHINHPCAVWVRESSENYIWTVQLLATLLDEYWLRYGQKKGRQHKVRTSGLRQALFVPPRNIPKGPLTPFALAMPDQYKDADPVVAYRNYYRGAKASLLKYSAPRSVPAWV